MNALIWMLAVASCAAAAVLMWWRQSRQLQAANARTQALARDLEALRRDLAALCTGALASDGHLGRIERELLRIAERQDRIELQGGGVADGGYERAARMVRGGAGLDELVEQCGLGRAEAGLLLRMQAARPEGGARAQAPGMRVSGVPM